VARPRKDGTPARVLKKDGRPKGSGVKYTKEKIEEMAEDLMKWADRDDSLVLRLWCCTQGRGDSLFCELMEKERDYKSRTFSQAVNYAKTIVGARREMLAGREGGIDSGIVRSTLANYDREHFNNIKEMKAEGKEDKKEPVVVNLVNYGDKKIKKK